MSKCKICPLCGKRNNPTSMECSECAADLMSVPITDPEIQKPDLGAESVATKELEASAAGSMVRTCSSCGTTNPPQLRKCQGCGEDISDILPTHQFANVQQSSSPVANASVAAAQVERHYQLSELNSGYVYNVPCGVMLIGREQGMRECLAQRPYVSRIHAKLIAQNGKLMVENLSGTNYTYVNNIKIPEGRTELHPGDELGLGGLSVNGERQDKAAYFLVGLAP